MHQDVLLTFRSGELQLEFAALARWWRVLRAEDVWMQLTQLQRLRVDNFDPRFT